MISPFRIFRQSGACPHAPVIGNSMHSRIKLFIANECSLIASILFNFGDFEIKREIPFSLYHVKWDQICIHFR